MKQIREVITLYYWQGGSGWAAEEAYKEEIYSENEIDWDAKISDWWKLPDEITKEDIENEDDVKITVEISDASTGEIIEVEEVWQSQLLEEKYKKQQGGQQK